MGSAAPPSLTLSAAVMPAGNMLSLQARREWDDRRRAWTTQLYTTEAGYGGGILATTSGDLARKNHENIQALYASNPERALAYLEHTRNLFGALHSMPLG